MTVGAEKSFYLLVFHEAKFLVTLRRQLRQNGKNLLSKAIRTWYERLLPTAVCVFRSHIHRQDGIYKAMNKRDLRMGESNNRMQWSMAVGRRRQTFQNRAIHVYIHRQREATRLLFSILGTRQACKCNVTLRRVHATIVAAEN
jgi:hypothetical protein